MTSRAVRTARVRRALVSAVLALACSACPREQGAEKGKSGAERSEHGAAAGAAHVDEAEHEELPSRIRLAPEVVSAAKITTVVAGREPFDEVLTLPGEISADPDKLARIATPIGGRVERVEFQEGQLVKRGDLLALVRVPEFGKAKAEYAGTQAKARAARNNADRLDELAKKGLAAQQEVLSARADADALDAQARAAGELLRAMGTTAGDGGVGSLVPVRSPLAGVVIARDAVVGQPVTSDQPLGTIADLAEVWFLARVFEKDLGRLRVGAVAEIRLNAYPKDGFDGAVEYIRQQIDPVARTLTARIRLKNREDKLRIGLFGSARVSTGEREPGAPRLVVPRSAVTDVADKDVVFVREPDGDFEMHRVVLGDAALGKVEVLSGIRDGEQVVNQGTFTLKSAILKSTFAEEGE